MDYHQDLSTEAQARIEAERILAQDEFDRAKENVRKSESLSTGGIITNHLTACIMRVFAAFGKEACDLGHKRIWTATQVEKHADEFLKTITNVVAQERGYDLTGTRLHTVFTGNRLDLDYLWRLRRSAKWREFEKDRLAVAIVQSKPATAELATPPAVKSAKTIGERLDEIVLGGPLSHEQLAEEIGISRSAYFEVKAGRGGRKVKGKTHLYLSKRSD